MARDMSTVVPAGGGVAGTVSVLEPPEGCVRMDGMLPLATGGNPNVVPAPPQHAGHAVDPYKCCFSDDCRGRKQAGTNFCAPHNVKKANEKARKEGTYVPTNLKKDTHGDNATGNQGLRP